MTWTLQFIISISFLYWIFTFRSEGFMSRHYISFKILSFIWQIKGIIIRGYYFFQFVTIFSSLQSQVTIIHFFFQCLVGISFLLKPFHRLCDQPFIIKSLILLIFTILESTMRFLILKFIRVLCEMFFNHFHFQHDVVISTYSLQINEVSL